jgi:AcrR family transcriptional regulator
MPASPSTSAQRDRYERVLQAATAMIAAGGEDTLRMKELSQRANVSLATLYRYFPSKDHVLLAIALSRYENAERRAASTATQGTVRERVTNHLLREFRAQQRDQNLLVAISRAMSETRPDYSEMVERIDQLHLQVIRRVAQGDGKLSDQHRRRLPIVVDTFGSAVRRWLSGASSPADARFQICLGCRLLDLPDSVVDEDLDHAAGMARSGSNGTKR